MRIYPLLLTVLAVAPALASAQSRRLEVDDAGWQLQGEGTAVGSFEGQPALVMRTGGAEYPDVALQDGTIEFDVAVTPHRSFVYLKFRIQSDGEYEDLYFRPHKSELPDAIQYSPVYRGASNWQLYHLEGNTAPTSLPPGRWIHMKVVIAGSQAAVFVDDMEQPKMIIPKLARDPRPGYIALRSFVPAGGAPAGVTAASFANVVVRPGDVSFRFPPTEIESPPGIVTAWEVSHVFAASDDPLETLATGTRSSQWQRLATDSDGLLVLGKYLDVPTGVRRPAVIARLLIRADRTMMARLNLGYSDDAIVAVNGTPLFYASDSYSFNFPRRGGLIGLDQAGLYLPLIEGENEILVAVSDVFGGWGLMAQLPSLDGLQIETP